MRIRLPGPVKNLPAGARRFIGHWTRRPAVRRHPVEQYIDRLTATAIQFNEIPSPTEKERQRTQFITRRLNEVGISDIDEDPEGNLSVQLPASSPSDESVLLFANIENHGYSPLNSLVKLAGKRAAGHGLGDNSLGGAALLVLAEYLQSNQLGFAKNVLLLFTPLQASGARFVALERFLERWRGGLPAALYVRGIHLGAVTAEPVGVCQLTVHVKTREQEVPAAAGAGSAVTVLADIASRLGGIRWDEQRSTSLNLARIEAGVAPGYFASEGVLELEVYSRAPGLLEMARGAVEATIRQVAEQTKAAIQVDLNSLIPVGDAESNRPLAEVLRRVHRQLGIRARRVSTPDPAAVLNVHGVPALSVGLTTGRKSFQEEYIDLPPLETGFRQLLLLLESLAGA